MIVKLAKESRAIPIYREVVHANRIDWWRIGCFQNKVKDYWPQEGERIEVLEELWFDRIGTLRLPIRLINKALAVPTMDIVPGGKAYPN